RKFADLCKRVAYQYPSLDLFSYTGAWSFPLLKNGVSFSTCVDQADLADSINATAKKNGLTGKIEFIRSDVFKFLEQNYREGKRYKIICSDPPAFTKSLLNKKKALEGYQRLHRAVLQVAD